MKMNKSLLIGLSLASMLTFVGCDSNTEIKDIQSTLPSAEETLLDNIGCMSDNEERDNKRVEEAYNFLKENYQQLSGEEGAFVIERLEALLNGINEGDNYIDARLKDDTQPLAYFDRDFLENLNYLVNDTFIDIEDKTYTVDNKEMLEVYATNITDDIKEANDLQKADVKEGSYNTYKETLIKTEYENTKEVEKRVVLLKDMLDYYKGHTLAYTQPEQQKEATKNLDTCTNCNGHVSMGTLEGACDDCGAEYVWGNNGIEATGTNVNDYIEEPQEATFNCINCGKAHTESESYYNEAGMSACSEACFNAYQESMNN